MPLADKFDKKVEAAALPQKTKDQIRKFLGEKEITDTQFKQILERVLAGIQDHPDRGLRGSRRDRCPVHRRARHADDHAYIPLRGCR